MTYPGPRGHEVMTPKVDPYADLKGRDLLDVLSYDEVAGYLKIDLKTLHRYGRGGKFPPPDDKIGGTPLWHSNTVKHWLSTRRRARINKEHS